MAVANISGSPLVRSFATVTDDGVLKYRITVMSGTSTGMHVSDDKFMKSYDPRDGDRSAATPVTAQASPGPPGGGGLIIAKGWPVPVGRVAGYDLYVSSQSGSGYRKLNDAPITAPSYTVRGRRSVGVISLL